MGNMELNFFCLDSEGGECWYIFFGIGIVMLFVGLSIFVDLDVVMFLVHVDVVFGLYVNSYSYILSIWINGSLGVGMDFMLDCWFFIFS